MESEALMLRAIYFALHFAVIFLGVVLAIHFDFTLGLLIAGTFTVKWLLLDRIADHERL